MVLNKEAAALNKRPIVLGGQAVIEGVMVKSRKNMSIAVRKPNGKIAVKKIRLSSLADKIKAFRLPFFRGALMLFEVLVLGIKALNYSASQASGEKENTSNLEIALTLVFSLGLAILIFKFLPLTLVQAASKFAGLLKNGVLFNITEGIVKLGIFLLYICLISQMKDVKRLFKYHGAEHMAISCFESGKDINIENVKKFSPIHRRCGTTFLFLVIFLSVIVYSFIPVDMGFWQKFFWRILLLPVIAGLSYEALKLGAKNEKSILVNAVVLPGLWLQKMTTAKPDSGQIEVAMSSVKTVLAMEKERVR